VNASAHPHTLSTRNVGIMIFPDVELLDFCGPHEAFSAAWKGDMPIFEVFTVAERDDVLATRGGLRVLPDYTFDSAPPIDVLVVPGGQGTSSQLENPAAIAWITRIAGRAAVTTSVCTGSFLLAQAGLLDGRRATTHWGSIERMRALFPATEVLAGVRWIDDGAVISSAGISAGIDMSLHVVERLCGQDMAASAARAMEYDYWQPGNAASPAAR
jgi:transcriptional regulator GlxA family with amidase domain